MQSITFQPVNKLNPSVLLGSQLIFNIGFYGVVPFLAIFLRDDIMLSGGIIGLILGLRTFSQQGMFIFGGALSDKFGGKVIILLGCIVRIVGYLLLAYSLSLTWIILGACLTGIGGALFSPSIEALLAKAGTRSEVSGKRSRAEWFALFAIYGELGAVIGPIAGAILSGVGFKTIALAGASIFVFALIALYFLLPSDKHHCSTLKITPWWTTFRNLRFVAFIIAYSTWFLSYNQLYLALPVELVRSGSHERDLAPLFMLASILVIFFQLPLARFSRRIGAKKILPFGFFLVSVGFLSVGLFAPYSPADGWLRLIPAISLVTLLTFGQMLLSPSVKDLIPFFATESTLGAHYGALATAGGVTVLIGNIMLGNILDYALIPSTKAMYPWLISAAFPLCSAFALMIICPKK